MIYLVIFRKEERDSYPLIAVCGAFSNHDTAVEAAWAAANKRFSLLEDRVRIDGPFWKEFLQNTCWMIQPTEIRDDADLSARDPEPQVEVTLLDVAERRDAELRAAALKEALSRPATTFGPAVLP